MGATSATGVGGAGSVEGIQKGSQNMSLGNNKLIGPHVVCGGQATIGGGGTVTVSLPGLDGVASQYIAFANDTNSTVAAVNVTSLTTSAITLKGTAAHVVNWVIMLAGF